MCFMDEPEDTIFSHEKFVFIRVSVAAAVWQEFLPQIA